MDPIDAAMKRMAEPLGAAVVALEEAGVSREHVNRILQAFLPLMNHALRLDARLSALERRMRTEAQIREARE